MNQTTRKEGPAAPVGAVLVVGGGVSGMQAALDLANAGFKVYLVESGPVIGGKMAQLDKTFPTNDCSMCIISPKLVEVGGHENIELVTCADVLEVQGEVGHFDVRIRQRARYVNVDKCTGCGDCESHCPVTNLAWFGGQPKADGHQERSVDCPEVGFTVEGRAVRGFESESLLTALRRAGFEVPSLCHHPAVPPAGACRLCLVEVQRGNRRRLTTSCDFPVQAGIQVFLDTDRVKAHRRQVLRLLLAQAPAAESIRSLAARHGVNDTPFVPQEGNDCILCGLCARMCEQVMQVGAIGMTGRGLKKGVSTPYEEPNPDCIACGACASVCPTQCIDLSRVSQRPVRPLLSEFNQGLGPRKPIHIPYPQAVPRVPIIDANACVHLQTGACGICATVCQAGAIEHDQVETVRRLSVGSVILAPGFEVAPASLRPELGYGQYPNVITNIEFERLLSASGPTSGHVVRPGDRTGPRRVAWIQCVASRDASCGHDYCSSVCCMAAVKEAVIAKEHDQRIEPAIFFIDVRAFGKGFDDYVQRASQQHGVRVVRAMVSRVMEDPQSGNLLLRYVSPEGKPVDEEFDLVVLSTGVQIPEKTRELARKLGVELDSFGFARTESFQPLATSRPGVFACGVFNAPKDIPETVAEASGAAGAAACHLAEARGSLVSVREVPVPRDCADEQARIGVVVCHCGINIAAVVDVQQLTETARLLPGVVWADHILYSCSQDSQERIAEVIDKERLNRLVVASCSPRTHEPLFQETLQRAGLNKYLFDMANIRDQCSWVHGQDRRRATEKARRLLAMAVANVSQARPLTEREIDVQPHLLVIGGGLAGMTAALQAARQGFDVSLVEQEAELGGRLRHLRRSLDGQAVLDRLRVLRAEIEKEQRIRIFTSSQVIAHSGYVGNFETEIMTPGGVTRTVRHGATVVATGAKDARPAGFRLGEDPRVLTQNEFEQRLYDQAGLGLGLKQVVMILCAGSRDEQLPYCSRVCCSQAIKNAMAFKLRYPDCRLDVLYRDIRSYGLGEIQFQAARRAGVFFIRTDPETNSYEIDFSSGSISIAVTDPSIRRRVALAPDLLVLANGVQPSENEELGAMLRVPRADNGFFIEAHAKLRPVDFASEGVYLAGLAHGPKSTAETVVQASAAVARAATILSRKKLRLSGIVSEVVAPERCAVCLTCVRACPYGVPRINEEHVVEINPALCQGCGICVAECPARVLSLGHYRDEQLLAKMDALRGQWRDHG